MELHLIYESILKGSLEETVKNTELALKNGAQPSEIIDGFMIKGMEEIGRRFEEGKAFVPNLLLSARAMRGGLDILKPFLKRESVRSAGTIVIGTVKGDLHDIGKGLVASMFEGCGFNVINLGVDVSSDKFVAAIKEHNADIVGMSALLTTTMDYMKVVIDDIVKAGLRDKVKIMIGGAPVSERFASLIGADAYSSNANSAVQKARDLMSK